MADKNQILKILKWLLPTGYEIIIYGTIIIATIIVSNFHFIEQFFELTDDFDIRKIILSAISTGLELLIGRNASASLTTGIFWGFFGIIIYIIILSVIRFSGEFSDDLASRKNIQPMGNDPNGALKSFLERNAFRLICGVALVLYLNFLVQIFLPFLTGNYALLLQNWPELTIIRNAVLMVVLQIPALHIIAILSRLVLLRRRVFMLTY